jgi:hypothetical protein
MKSRYLLYLDILGFSDLVERDPDKVGPLYHAISKMRAHEHGDFQTIVFSDTVLVYNKASPRTANDHTYVVMFLCEFDVQSQRFGHLFPWPLDLWRI